MPDASLLDVLRARIEADPFNAVATAIFALAVTHTFFAARFTHWSHALQRKADADARARGIPPRPSVAAETLHFFGEVEVIFGLWALPLMVAIDAMHGWTTAAHYVNSTVNYTEPLFVVVIMALAATRPVVLLAENTLRRLANLGGSSPAAWWVTILILGPLMGSFITEPAAMTISALLLARQLFDLGPSKMLKYATLGVLFVNVSVGGTLTNFAAPPVLMVAGPWNWDMRFMISNIGDRATLSILVTTVLGYLVFRKEFKALANRGPSPDPFPPEPDAEPDFNAPLPVPAWVTAVHLAFLAWTVFNAHYPVLFVGGFLFFLGFARATAPYQSAMDLRTPLLVGFFLAGLVIHGGLQSWWLGPTLSRLSESGMFFGATVLTAFNDNALITYLATLAPQLSDTMKLAIVQGAVTGGGLTVIANAPNPAGQALLGRFFEDGVEPLKLALAAAIPTLITIAAFRLF